MKQLTYFCFLALPLLFAACKEKEKANECMGTGDKIYVERLNLKPSTEDTLNSNGAQYSILLQLLPEHRTEKGTMSGDCGTRVFPTEEPEKVDTSAVEVFCDRDLVKGGVIVANGQNLLKRGDVLGVRVYADGDIMTGGSITIQTDTAYKGHYNYYIIGHTTLGNSFADTVAIFYK